MITWIILGYLAVSLVTSLFIYAAYIVAARSDELEQSTFTEYPLLTYPVNNEQSAPAVTPQLVLSASR